jgi:hypothetical protein
MNARPSIFQHPAKLPPSYEQLAIENQRLRRLRTTHRRNIRTMQAALVWERKSGRASLAAVELAARKAADLEKDLAEIRGAALGLSDALERYRGALAIAASELTGTERHKGKFPRQIQAELLADRYPPIAQP